LGLPQNPQRQVQFQRCNLNQCELPQIETADDDLRMALDVVVSENALLGSSNSFSTVPLFQEHVVSLPILPVCFPSETLSVLIHGYLKTRYIRLPKVG